MFLNWPSRSLPKSAAAPTGETPSEECKSPRNRCLLLFALLLGACTSKKAKVESEPSPAQFKVSLQTTKGDVVILVHRDWSPLGADHFYELTKMGFYDDNRFFRALKGFIVQWGMNGDPKVNKSWSEIPIKDDPPKVQNKTEPSSSRPPGRIPGPPRCSSIWPITAGASMRKASHLSAK